MRIFTILLMSVCALVGSKRAIADDALSTLIGDNKVWNYRMSRYSQDKPLGSVDSYKLCCNGTVEKNGMEYAKVVYKDDNKELAYIREEDGKLFISSESPVFEIPGDIYGFTNIHEDFADLPELPVFDFNAKEGETFQGLVNWIEGYRIGEIKVKKIETKTVGDFEVRIITVTQKVKEKPYVDSDEECEYELGEQQVIEGIGYLQDWFFMPETVDYTTSIYGDQNPVWFDRLTDMEGNKIITIGEIFPPAPPKPREYAHTIRKDRTWVYSFVKDGVEETKSLHFGDKIHNDYGYYYPVINEKDETVAHLAYAYYDDSTILRYVYDSQEISDFVKKHGGCYNGDFEVYRFGAANYYDTFTRLTKSGKYQESRVTVESSEEVTIAGEKCRRQVVGVTGRKGRKFVVIEGIGADTGWLYEPAWGDREAEEVNGLATLKEVLDGEGNVIFRHEDFGPTGAVEDVLDDAASENDTRMFDLFGREIRDPQPGTIYVQGGRKFVAR